MEQLQAVYEGREMFLWLPRSIFWQINFLWSPTLPAYNNWRLILIYKYILHFMSDLLLSKAFIICHFCWKSNNKSNSSWNSCKLNKVSFLAINGFRKLICYVVSFLFECKLKMMSLCMFESSDLVGSCKWSHCRSPVQVNIQVSTIFHIWQGKCKRVFFQTCKQWV